MALLEKYGYLDKIHIYLDKSSLWVPKTANKLTQN